MSELVLLTESIGGSKTGITESPGVPTFRGFRTGVFTNFTKCRQR